MLEILAAFTIVVIPAKSVMVMIHKIINSTHQTYLPRPSSLILLKTYDDDYYNINIMAKTNQKLLLLETQRI